ncbi:MAG: hypothetical protein AAB657_01690 [Patescibacteria group bacterium]
MLKRSKSISNTVLTSLYASGLAAVEFYNWTNNFKHWGYHYESNREWKDYLKYFKNKKKTRNLLYSLNRRKYIKINKTGDKVIISLTDKGKMAALKNSLLQTKKMSDKYTVVIFDIPETARLARVLFRKLLKEASFKKLQQSVWISNGDARDIMIKFIKEQKIDKWVNVFYATDLFKKLNI